MIVIRTVKHSINKLHKKLIIFNLIHFGSFVCTRSRTTFTSSRTVICIATHIFPHKTRHIIHIVLKNCFFNLFIEKIWLLHYFSYFIIEFFNRSNIIYITKSCHIRLSCRITIICLQSASPFNLLVGQTTCEKTIQKDLSITFCS